jgi:Zn-dependent metalloprotease
MERFEPTGERHERYQQEVNGWPLRGREAWLHFDERGELRGVEGTALDAPLLAEVERSLGANSPSFRAAVVDEAFGTLGLVRTGEPRRAVSVDAPYGLGGRDKAARDQRARDQAADGTLVVARFEYEVDGRDAASVPYVVTFDARSWEVLRIDAVRQHVGETEGAAGSGIGVTDRFRPLVVAPAGDRFTLGDEATPAGGVATRDARNTTDLPGATLVSANPHAWSPAAAVDAHAHAATVLRAWKALFGRSGIDGNGSPLLQTVRYGTKSNEAFWDGNQLAFGDGDGVQYRALSTALDVVAHEATHALIAATSKLAYRDQSGALNEAMADLFAVFVEHAAESEASASAPAADRWRMGEHATLDGKGVRNLADPGASGHPAHMADYVQTRQNNGGVHINSTIFSHGAYLLTEGGEHAASGVRVSQGIGFERAAQLFYRANALHFVSGTDFRGAAEATRVAAGELGFSAAEREAIECAWQAVGILQGNCPTAPKQPSAEVAAPRLGSDAARPSRPSPKDLGNVSCAVTDGVAGSHRGGIDGSYGAVGCILFGPWLRRRKRRRRA